MSVGYIARSNWDRYMTVHFTVPTSSMTFNEEVPWVLVKRRYGGRTDGRILRPPIKEEIVAYLRGCGVDNPRIVKIVNPYSGVLRLSGTSDDSFDELLRNFVRARDMI